MGKSNRIIPRGPFKGKKIELASTQGIETFKEIVEDFMERIFDFEPGEYLITDESNLFDFTGVDEMEMADIYKEIQGAYNLDVSDIESGKLLEIFTRIHKKKHGLFC